MLQMDINKGDTGMHFCTVVFNTGDTGVYRFSTEREAIEMFNLMLRNESVIFAVYGEVGEEITNSWTSEPLRP